MKDEHDHADPVTRRDFLRIAGAGAMARGIGAGIREAAAATDAKPGGRPPRPAGQYNILFLLTDQERFFRPGELPEGYSLPAHERLKARGTTFVNHRINSCVCTPSRSVLYTGQHIQHTRMFDNTNFPWITSMSTEIRTVGDLLREAGYYLEGVADERAQLLRQDAARALGARFVERPTAVRWRPAGRSCRRTCASPGCAG